MQTTRVSSPTDMNYDNYYTGRKTIAALFTNRSDAESAINALKDMGLKGDQIGVAMRDRDAQGKLVDDTGTKAAEGTVTGAVSGGVLGGVVGFLIGIGALAIPGIGPVISAGVLTAALGTAGATAAAGAGIGAVAGGVVGALVGIGIPESEAKYFESGLREGSTLVTVNSGSRSAEIARVLKQYGGDLGVTTTEPVMSTPMAR